MGVWVCPSTSHPVTLLSISIDIPHKPLYLPKTELLSMFFHHTALEVSPVTSGTSCSPTALAPSLRARGNTATTKHPAAAPMTSGSHVPKPPW